MTGVEIFFAFKAILGVITLGMLIYYMGYVWSDVEFPGRKMRYISLLWFTLTIVMASARQITSPVNEIYLEQWLVMAGLLFLFITMVVSIKEFRKISGR